MVLSLNPQFDPTEELCDDIANVGFFLFFGNVLDYSPSVYWDSYREVSQNSHSVLLHRNFYITVVTEL